MPNITSMIRQGQWEVEMGINVGVMIFDLTAIRNQFITHSPVRATLQLNRTGSGTHGLALPLFLYAGNQQNIPPVNMNVSTPAPRPTRVSAVFSTTISAGQGAKTVGISTALINSIGNGSSNCLFMDADGSFANYMSFTGRQDLTRVRLVIEWTPRTTVATAPTSLSVNQTIAENNVTLSWSGAAAGINNAITGYDVEFSDSTNNSTWGAWQTLTTVSITATSGSLSVAPPTVRGNFRRFRIRTRGAAGSSFFSGWRISSNSVRRNTWSNPPTTVIASPEIYADETVTVFWSGSSQNLSPIRGYQIASRTSTDNLTWSAWNILAVINLASTFGQFVPTVSRVPGTYTQFGVWTVDTLGSYSGEAVSNSVLNIPLDRPPLAPIVSAPRNGSVTYNTKPMVFIQVQPEPDGQLQTVLVQVDNGEWHNSVEHPEYFTTSGQLEDNVRTVYTSDELAVGTHTVEIRTGDGNYYSPAVYRTITVLASPFDTITFNQTAVKARHITDLRTAINNNRSYYNMAAYAWGEAITSGETLMIYWPFHILELRAALEAVINFINDFDVAASQLGILPLAAILPLDWLPIGTRRPRAAVMNQLMDLVYQV